ncbi:MAG TPA: DUF3300 domain-containing protein [Terriglobales bacterium]|nr:DUF3300 domain-containing protein [Terriglobales bacterium]
MKLVLRDSTALLLVLVLSFAGLTNGCKSTSSREGATPQSPSSSQAPPAQQMSVDDLVAPIALYPDQLLAQVLTTAANPQEVLDLGNWLLQNQNLQGDAATNAAKQAGFSASAQYLAMFPQVVDNMCQQMDWTRQLGEAFKSDQKGVMDAVQRKRTQAQQMGNLQSSPQMTVAAQTDNGQQYVQIQPTDPKVVYVPQYNPVTIYNTPAPAAAPATTTTTTTEEKSGVSTGAAVAIGLLSFGVGMAVGSAIHNDNYYPYPAWGYGGVYYGGRPYYPPPYRPPVYPGYRPVYGYNPPAAYRWNQYNRNVNVNVNNNYYNRFNNQNAGTYSRPGYEGGGTANPRLAQSNQPSWKGQTTYQGARPSATQGEKPGAAMANAIPRNEQYGNRGNNQTAANRPNAGNPGTVNMAANRSNMGNAGASNMAGRPAPEPNMKRGGDRGYGAPSNAARPASSSLPATRPASSSYENRANTGGGAFGGGNAGSGRSEREASSRGRSSLGASGRGAGMHRGR